MARVIRTARRGSDGHSTFVQCGPNRRSRIDSLVQPQRAERADHDVRAG